MFKKYFNVKNFKKLFKIAGPGLITGAADDDPSGIATYMQAGAQFGLKQLWTAVFMLPFMIAVQQSCAKIGAVTGKGIAEVIKEHYGKKLLYTLVGLLLIANTINIGADIGAMSAAAELIIPINYQILAVLFAIIILLLEIFTSYKVYAHILKWLALSLLAYPLTALIVANSWGILLKETFHFSFEFSFEYLFIITGVFGTTISPYMFFWQASEEVEEEKSHHLLTKLNAPKISKNFLRRLRLDNALGMIVSEIATWSIIVVGALVLHNNGIFNVDSAADAAKAIEPLVNTFPNAGFLAKVIFATGIIGLGLLSVPVLSGSVSYAISETFNFKEGLNLKFKKAHGFYGVIIIATLIGLLLNFIGINPVKALVYAAVLNGVLSVPLLVMIARISNNKNIMGKYKNHFPTNVLLYATIAMMGTMVLLMVITSFK